MHVDIEGTYGALRDRAREVIGPDAFDETAFAAHLRGGRTGRLDLSGGIENRLHEADQWTLMHVDPLAGGPLKLIGHGTDHAVYVDPSRPGQVTKISVETLGRLIRWLMLFGRGEELRTPQSIRAAGQVLARKEIERDGRLRLKFPAEVVPRQSIGIDEISVRAVVAQFLLQGGLLLEPHRSVPALNSHAIYRLPALVRHQNFLPQLSDPATMHFSLSLHYVERFAEPPPDESYADINNSLVLNRPGKFNKDHFDYCFTGTKLSELYDASETDKALRDSIRDFLRHAIDFMNYTGEVVDIAGDGNVIFNTGRYYLPDALVSPNFEGALRFSANTLRRLKQPEEIALGSEAWMLTFTLSIVRAMNAMAQALGIDERVHLLHPDEESEPIDWASVLWKLRDSRTAAANHSLEREPLLMPVESFPWGIDTHGLAA
ncbi:hypothetical protein GWC77_21055 [Paraburkholderia sp. NMBU_R16]|uniref:hypothetical protein n=1 Tax=Paraburkholderia sp. NMBU_R16 TaxID=2698676 RepID=UPI001563355A|nr:hypothetical protein [Paraburkholderia sp. NMBU_R16]NRO98416.1 hypothetical protein [Paraburkholderia sp. NMBU_R16]